MAESSQIIGSIFIFYSKHFGIQQRQKDDAQDYHDETLNRFCYKNEEKKNRYTKMWQKTREKSEQTLKRKEKKKPIQLIYNAIHIAKNDSDS